MFSLHKWLFLLLGVLIVILGVEGFLIIKYRSYFWKPAYPTLALKLVTVESEIPSMSIQIINETKLRDLWIDNKNETVKSIDESQLPSKLGFENSPPEKVRLLIMEPPSVSLSEEPTTGVTYLVDGYSVEKNDGEVTIKIFGPGLDYSRTENVRMLNATINMRLVKSARFIQQIKGVRTLEWRDSVINEFRSYANPNKWIVKLVKL